MKISQSVGMGEFRKIMQGDHACHYRSQGGGNLWVAGVREALHAVHRIAVYFGVEGVAHLSGCARKLDRGASRSDLYSVKSFGAQPACSGLEVGVGGSKLRAEVLGSQPGVEFLRIEGALVLQ